MDRVFVKEHGKFSVSNANRVYFCRTCQGLQDASGPMNFPRKIHPKLFDYKLSFYRGAFL